MAGFWKQLIKRSTKIKQNRTLPHIKLKGGVSTKSLLGLPFLFPSSLEECKRNTFCQAAKGKEVGRALVISHKHTSSEWYSSTSSERESLWGSRQRLDGGTVCTKLHTETHDKHEDCVNKTPHTARASPRLKEYNLLIHFLSKTQSIQPPSSYS